MRKSILALSSCVLSLSLVAAKCGGGGESESTSTEADSAMPEAADVQDGSEPTAPQMEGQPEQEQGDLFTDPLDAPEPAPGEEGDMPLEDGSMESEPPADESTDL